MAETGAPENGSTAKLLALRSRAILSARDDYDGARPDADRALALARAEDDEQLELEALQLVAQIDAERGEPYIKDWLEVEAIARRLGRWDTVVRSLSVQAGMRVDDDPDAALPLEETAAKVCAARGLVEMAAWCDYGRAEAQFCAGRWDEAIEAGLQAVEAGEAHDFHRVVVRSWFVLLPIARARGCADLVTRGYPRFATRRDLEQPSPYARIVSTAAHLHFAAQGLEEAFVPDIQERLVSFDLDHAGPSWLASVDTVVGTWLNVGDLDSAEFALDRMRTRNAQGSSQLGRATEAILRARLLALRGDAEAAGEAERVLAALGDRAPWWRRKAIRVLEDVGAASAALAREARAIDAQLGLG